MFKKRKLIARIRPYLDRPEAIVITGFRRVGKTAILRHLYEQTPSKNKLFLDLENPLNQRIFEARDYDVVLQEFAGRNLATSGTMYVFLDEIQFAHHIPSVAKYLMDHYRVKFFMTGSSSFYLKNLFSESLAGRKFLFELFPLDFEEFLWFTRGERSAFGSHDMMMAQYDEYLRYGGFPSVVLARSPDEKAIELDNILGSYFQLDVRTFAQFRDNENLRNLLLLLAPRAGSKADVSKLADALRVSRSTVYHYLDFLSHTYLISQLRAYSASSDVRIRHNPKIYFNDSGLLNRIFQVSRGQLFDSNIHHILLARASYERPGSPVDLVHYYQTATGREIDFIVGGKRAIEVKLTASSRDVGRLAKLASRLGIPEYAVVTLSSVSTDDPHIIFPYQI